MRKERYNREALPSRGGGGSHTMAILTLFLTLLIVAVGILKNMDQKRQIAEIDKKIAELSKEIESCKPLIKNKQVYLESLKNSKVVDYARQRNMTSPRPGQVCVINMDDVAVREVMLVSRDQAKHQETAVVMK